MKPNSQSQPSESKTAPTVSVREAALTAVEVGTSGGPTLQRQVSSTCVPEYRALVNRHFVDRVRLSWNTATRLEVCAPSVLISPLTR